ncbi:MAG TPA: 2-dehydropantoate 2-reductase N-terminal domain-containing protein [Streptosporangiaceae bacterium]|nr:2-dehydropantoate 2-reductase N-terminal domain-containing protein [Streptosporangiaceae bacterium]
MRIAVYGAGGVGGYFGGRLAQSGAEVHFIARGAHLQAIREHGLRVRSVKGDFEVQVTATDDPADIGACDFVLFCVKSFDTAAAAARLGPLVGEDTAVVTLQNGVDNEEKLARAVGERPRNGRGCVHLCRDRRAQGSPAHRRPGQHHIRGTRRQHQPAG